MDRLHSTTRIDAGLISRYNLPPGFFHMRNGKSAAGSNIFDWLASIEEVVSYAELDDFFTVPLHRDLPTTGHSSVYNFENLVLRGALEEDDIKKTIEFRQHAGTLDFNDIMSWAALTCAIVDFCHTASDSDFLSLLMYGIDPGTGIRDLCSGVGVPDHITSHLTGEAELPYQMSAPSRLPHTMFREVWAALDEMNDEESAELRDPELVDRMIKTKFAQGTYGINPAINIVRHSQEAINRLMLNASTQVARAERSDHVEFHDEASRIRWIMLGSLARMYSCSAGVDDLEGLDGEFVFLQAGNIMRFDLPEEADVDDVGM